MRIYQGKYGDKLVIERAGEDGAQFTIYENDVAVASVSLDADSIEGVAIQCLKLACS